MILHFIRFELSNYDFVTSCPCLPDPYESNTVEVIHTIIIIVVIIIIIIVVIIIIVWCFGLSLVLHVISPYNACIRMYCC